MNNNNTNAQASQFNQQAESWTPTNATGGGSGMSLSSKGFTPSGSMPQGAAEFTPTTQKSYNNFQPTQNFQMNSQMPQPHMQNQGFIPNQMHQQQLYMNNGHGNYGGQQNMMGGNMQQNYYPQNQINGQGYQNYNGFNQQPQQYQNFNQNVMGGGYQNNYQNQNGQGLYNNTFQPQPRKSQTQGGGQYGQYQKKTYNKYNNGNNYHNGGYNKFNNNDNEWASSQNVKDFSSNKIKNVATPNTQVASSGLNPNMKSFKPSFKPQDVKEFKPFIPTTGKFAAPAPAATTPAPQPVKKAPAPPPVDPIVEKLKKIGETEESQVKLLKELIKEKKDENKDVITLDFFKKVGELKICDSKEKTPEEMKYSVYSVLLEREVKARYDMTVKRGNRDGNRGGRGRGGNHYGRGGRPNYNHDGEDGDFSKGGGRPYPRHKQDWNQGGWKQEDNEEKKKLKQQAQAMQEKIKKPKSEAKQIRLIMNVIAPDNFDKKFGQLRDHLYKGLKTRDECFTEEIEYDADTHKLQDNIDEEILDIIVNRIFAKAQSEKEYCIFYGQLVENLIKLEVQLRDLDVKLGNQKHSEFRKSLFNVCKTCFEKFFSEEEKQKHAQDKEQELVFQQKLFGNINFVGELYRRKILPENILVNVFQSLQGNSDTNQTVDDLVTEASIKLMNKVGQKYEENIKNQNKKKEEKLKQYDEIMDRFKAMQDDTEGKRFAISNRIRLLIKNMFDNKQSGWQKTKDANENGPKTKAEVQNEVQEKYNKEQQAREEGRHNNRGYGGDRRDNRDNRDRHYNDNRRDGQQRYRQKDNQNNRYQARDRDNRGGDNDDGDERQGGNYGKGGREDRRDNNRRHNRNDEREKQQIIEIDDDKMGEIVKKNFEQFAQKMDLAAQQPEEEDEEDKSPEKDKKFDLSVYKTLRNTNGKNADKIFFSLLCRVFDEDMRKIENHFVKYLEILINQKQFKKNDFSDGISKFITFMPEVVLDVPQISEYLFKFVIKPLMDMKMVNLQYIKWNQEPEKNEEDEDDIVFDSTDCYFKLMNFILLDHAKKGSMADTVKYYNDQGWRKISQDKYEKIEDADELWSYIKDKSGDNADIMIALLNQDKTDSQKNHDVVKKILK